MNGVDFPVARVLDGIAAARSAGPGADQGQHRRPARPQRGVDPAAGPLGARRGAGPALHRVHGRRALRTAGGWTTWCRRTRSSPRSTPSCRWSPWRRTTGARWPGATGTATGAARSGVIASVTRPFCGDCTRARLSAEGQLYTCLFAVDGTDLKGPLRAGEGDEELADRIRAVWAVARRPLLGAAERGDGAPAEGGDVRPRRAEPPCPPRAAACGPTRLVHRLSTPVQVVEPGRGAAHVRGQPRWSPGAAPVTLRLARRGRRRPGAEEIASSPLHPVGRDHLKAWPAPRTAITSRSGRSPVRFGRFVHQRRAAREGGPVGRPEGRDRHPGVGTPAGRRSLPAPCAARARRVPAPRRATPPRRILRA